MSSRITRERDGVKSGSEKPDGCGCRRPEPEHPALRLQQRIGNRAVSSLIGPASRADLASQGSLRVGRAGDRAEGEADAAADAVMRASKPVIRGAPGPGLLQRACTSCEEEEELRRKSAPNATATTPPDLQRSVSSLKRQGGRGLDRGERSFFEPRFSADLSAVRIHDNAAADGVARSVHARAFTVGNDIGFRRGAYQPRSNDGQRLLAHELAHVLQQTGPVLRREVDVDSARDAAADEAVERAKDRGYGPPISTPEGVAFDEVDDAPQPEPGAAEPHEIDALADDEPVDEPVLMGKSATGRTVTPFTASPPAQTAAPLPARVRSDLERGFGQPLHDVRLHRGPNVDRYLGGQDALAAARGSSVYLRSDVAVDPSSFVLAHEIAHVVQQRPSSEQGVAERGCRPAAAALEREADRAAETVTRGRRATALSRAARGRVQFLRCAAQRTHVGRAATNFTGARIDRIEVRLGCPTDVELFWSGSRTALAAVPRDVRSPFRGSPGAGQCRVDCENERASSPRRCTPKGRFTVSDKRCHLGGHTDARFATYFHSRGIAFHRYPCPAYPASHGCVRIPNDRLAAIIMDNSVTGSTTVSVTGTYPRRVSGGRPHCYNPTTDRVETRALVLRGTAGRMRRLGMATCPDGALGRRARRGR